MIIIIPLHMPLKYPCDYIDQTSKILSRDNTVIFLDYHFPYSWKSLLKFNNIRLLINSFFDIYKSKRIVYFRAPAILPFSKSEIIRTANKKLGFWILSVFLWMLKKKMIVWQFYTLITKKVFKKQFFIYDCIDYMNLEDETKKFFYQEKKLFKISDLVSFNSKALFENKLKTNPILKQKSIVTVCGCNNKLFDVKIKKTPKEYINLNQKKVIFIGIFNFRIDAELLQYVVAGNRKIKFIFIGPILQTAPKEFKKILKEKNVQYLGKKGKNKLPFYLNKCGLGIIPYDIKSDFVKYSNPMKAYEYLASGLPVVSTRILALKDYPRDIVYTTDNRKNFSKAINRMINGWDNKKAKIARDIAEKNSWENKISLVEKFIIKNEKIN